LRSTLRQPLLACVSIAFGVGTLALLVAARPACAAAPAAGPAVTLAANGEMAEEVPPPAWVTGPDGVRYRVRFDLGERLIAGAGAGFGGAGVVPVLEVGLLLRSDRPAPGWDVHWKRDHALAHLRLQPAAGDPTVPVVDGVLYRGLFLRQSREGTLTLPLSPPVAFTLPFDVGVRVEAGRLRGPLRVVEGGAPLRAEVVHGEVVADFLRARKPGRWVLIGVGGRYEVGYAGAASVDHRVAPMTALSAAVRGERSDGLLAGGARVEASRRWSSARGWENAWRADAEAEAVPLALNDRPLSVFAAAAADSQAGGGRPDVQVMVGVRLSEPRR
jgi:hypothetical protein